MSPARLDAELVRRGLVRSRGRAAELVAGGRVRVDGRVATKPSAPVAPDTVLAVAADDVEYVSRGARKLVGALDDLARLGAGPDPAGAVCLDAGASTGGFTQVLLERGAAQVLAVDVGHGQLDPGLAADPRVTVREGVNVRELVAGDLPRPVDLVVADLSFISLTLVLGPLVAATRPGGDLLVLVKPQFEVGRGRTADGVVTSPQARADAVVTVAGAVPAPAHVAAVLPSRLPGPAGNVEYFLWLSTSGRSDVDVAAGVRHAVMTGTPQLLGTPPRGRRS